MSEEGVRVAPEATAPVSASGSDREDGLAVVHADFRIGLWLNPDLAIDFPEREFGGGLPPFQMEQAVCER